MREEGSPRKGPLLWALDHVSVSVSDARRARRFYDPVLGALGLVALHDVELPNRGLVGVGYGQPGGAPVFWIQTPMNEKPADPGNGVHVAFAARSRSAVDAFYLAALDHGGADDGRPGLRTEYAPDYYAAFVRDPDGNKLEAVRHGLD